ncbi:MAG: ABC transporter ATP-binding protein [Fuerstiella sp.]
MPALEFKDVCRRFPTAAGELNILSQVNLQLSPGQAVALRGPSGCGKSTLLHIAGTLDRPTSGSVTVAEQDPWSLTELQLAEFRNRHVGFIFQEHQLLPQCTVLENVLLPTLAGFTTDKKEAQQRALQLIESVGLSSRLQHRPASLSGGERQRVAVCRAMIQKPSLLLADEPTGNLDPTTAESVGQLLLDLASAENTALLCVTHSDALAESFPETATMENQTLQFNPSSAASS